MFGLSQTQQFLHHDYVRIGPNDLDCAVGFGQSCPRKFVIDETQEMNTIQNLVSYFAGYGNITQPFLLCLYGYSIWLSLLPWPTSFVGHDPHLPDGLPSTRQAMRISCSSPWSSCSLTMTAPSNRLMPPIIKIARVTGHPGHRPHNWPFIVHYCGRPSTPTKRLITPSSHGDAFIAR